MSNSKKNSPPALPVDIAPVDVVVAERIEAARRLGGLGAAALRVPAARTGMKLLLTVDRGGKRRTVPDSARAEMTAGDAPWAVHVRSEPWPLDLSFLNVGADADGHPWNVSLAGTWVIDDPARFLEEALDRISPDSPLRAQELTAWATGRCIQQVRDVVSDYARRHMSPEQLRDKSALPVEWWQAQLAEWLSPAGLRAAVAQVDFFSAEADDAKRERRRIEQDNQFRQDRQRLRDLELTDHQQESAFDQELKKIEFDALLTSQQREDAIDELNDRRELRRGRFQREMRQLAFEVEQLNGQIAEEAARDRDRQQRARREEQEWEVEAERDRQNYEIGLKLRQAQVSEAEAKAQKEAEVVALLRKFGQNASPEEIQGVCADLLGGNRVKMYQAAEVVTGDWGVDPRRLQSAGCNVSIQLLVRKWRDKAREDGNPVRFNKRELVRRDIRLPLLRIGARLDFTLQSERAGHVTILNLGTSGDFFLMCPSSLCSPDRARVAAHRPYALPGPELFDIDGSLSELGPAGHEHLVALISNEPLIQHLGCNPGDLVEPILEVSTQSVASLSIYLESNPGLWTAGVLSFEVSK